ncbi:hypothetical protein [Streptomyces johnsoniae]|uniref:hypothetical protein n=1 Tax=Streptomyces johnsoniae TaxID=3075532 RepID=UPI0028895F4E|nr:hypothetical protein [Streptomyces sp. DSM 41886]
MRGLPRNTARRSLVVVPAQRWWTTAVPDIVVFSFSLHEATRAAPVSAGSPQVSNSAR